MPADEAECDVGQFVKDITQHAAMTQLKLLMNRSLTGQAGVAVRQWRFGMAEDGRLADREQLRAEQRQAEQSGAELRASKLERSELERDLQDLSQRTQRGAIGQLARAFKRRLHGRLYGAVRNWQQRAAHAYQRIRPGRVGVPPFMDTQAAHADQGRQSAPAPFMNLLVEATDEAAEQAKADRDMQRAAAEQAKADLIEEKAQLDRTRRELQASELRATATAHRAGLQQVRLVLARVSQGALAGSVHQWRLEMRCAKQRESMLAPSSERLPRLVSRLDGLAASIQSRSELSQQQAVAALKDEAVCILEVEGAHADRLQQKCVIAEQKLGAAESKLKQAITAQRFMLEWYENEKASGDRLEARVDELEQQLAIRSREASKRLEARVHPNA